MVESSGLLNRRRVKNSTGGSNPPLSASFNSLRLLAQTTSVIVPATLPLALFITSEFRTVVGAPDSADGRILVALNTASFDTSIFGNITRHECSVGERTSVRCAIRVQSLASTGRF